VASLQRAQSELKNGHPLQALLLLDELDQNYPSEVLLEERSAVRVHAQCAASRSPSSVVAARSFVRANPGSLYADRIRQACGIE
jgi:outer membrane protein assembly factor BamD (BamD/ComL family)